MRHLAGLVAVLLCVVGAFVLYAMGVREWWILAIILIGLAVFATVETVRVYRQTRRSVVQMKVRGERRLRMDEIRRIANGEKPL